MKSVVLPAIKKTGVATGTTAYLTINGADTTAAQAQLDSFIERWKSEGVNALFITGQDAVTKQFVEKVTKQMPGITLLTDTGDALPQGQDETKAGIEPEPVPGHVLIAGGFAAADYDQERELEVLRRRSTRRTSDKDAPGRRDGQGHRVGGKELTTRRTTPSTTRAR